MRSKDALVEMANLIVESVSEKFDAIIPNKELAVHMYTEHIELISDVPSREKALHIAEDAKILCGIEDTGWLEKVASLNMTGVQEQREDVEMQIFSIGDWCMCGGPYEFMVGFALDAARILQNKFFYLNGYTNGCLLYFPTEEEFEAGGYEVFWSMLIYYRYLDRVYARLEELQQELLKRANAKQDYNDLADEIDRLREMKQNAMVENAGREGLKQRIAEMKQFLAEQTERIEEYDESLVRRMVERITVYEDKFTVEFKSGTSVDVDR